VKRFVASLMLGMVAVATTALGDAIQKWLTPDGFLYFGDRPPKGSTLVETYPDTPSLPATVVSSDLAALSEAAADGRDIIRRREEARKAERQADAARELRVAEIEASQIGAYDSAPFWFVTGGISPCRFGASCGDDFRFFGRRVPHAHDRLLPKSRFLARRQFFSSQGTSGHLHFYRKVPSHPRLAPAQPSTRHLSARFGGR
jgi:hypothetical protein